MSLFGIKKDGVVYKKYKSEAIVKKCYGSGDIIIQSEIDGVPVTAINEHAFENSNIRSLYIPDTIGFIGSSAFENSRLISVNIPNPPKITVAARAFYGCKFLKTVNIEIDGLMAWGAVFRNCVNLENIDISKFTTIDPGAFAYCTSINEFNFSEHLNSIDAGAFEGCIGLKTAILPDRLVALRNGAFKNCVNLTTVVLSKNLNSLGGAMSLGPLSMDYIENPFEGCTSLKRLLYHGTKEEINFNVEKYFTDKTDLKIFYFDEENHSSGTWHFDSEGKIQYYI